MFDITAAAIATIISGATSTSVTLLIAATNNKKSLDDQLDAILKIAVQYPYLESRNFTEQWTSKHDENDERMLRYDLYCNLLFNYLSRISKKYNYSELKIEDELAMKSWVRLHRKNWLDPREAYENVDAYNQEFINLMDQYTKGVA